MRLGGGHAPVLHHVGVPAEGVVTHGALDGRAPRVHVVVLRQLLARRETLLANLTPETTSQFN